jgi:hypothetical protein
MLVGPVDIDESGLADLQFVNPTDQPLKKLKPVERDTLYLNVAKRVKELLLRGDEVSEPYQPNREEAPSGSDNTIDHSEPEMDWAASWTASVPPELAEAEIRHQLSRLQHHARSRGFAVFERNGYYVQFANYAALGDSSVVVEAQSNAHLEGSRRLGPMQMHYLTEVLQFSRVSEDENLLMYAPFDSEKSIAQLATITWHVLRHVYTCPARSPLVITAQCL